MRRGGELAYTKIIAWSGPIRSEYNGLTKGALEALCTAETSAATQTANKQVSQSDTRGVQRFS